MSEGPAVKHTGGCHCGAVRFEVWAPEEVTLYNCNCTICMKKQMKPFIVPHASFKLLQGEDMLTTYTYGTGLAKHRFCKICGVQSFYQPRSRPDGTGVEAHCLDPGTMKKVTYMDFDGINFEESLKALQEKTKKS